MNKKYLIIGIVLILAVNFTNIAKANNFNDILNTLINQLYWLRDNLKAQVQIKPATYPYPVTSKTPTSQPVTSKPVLEYYMKTCQKDFDCGIVNTDCCSCFNGGSNESLWAINRSYSESFIRNMTSYCNHYGVQCRGLNFCSQDARLNSITCKNNQCYAEFYGKYIPTTSTPAGKLTTTTTTKFTLPSTTTSTSTTTTITTTQPQTATDQWYKLTEFQGCNMDDWSKTCADTNAAKSSGNEYKYCMNQYLLSKKITFTDLTVPTNKPVDGAVTCMACGCEMPEIYLKAKTNFENQLKDIGFTKSSNPEAKDELYAEGNKLSADLSYQGLFYKEDRDTSKINYAIISKNDKVTCGDLKCDSSENYLYQIDLSKHCSPLSDKIINFNHCSQDCKNTFNEDLSITKDAFNKLEFLCKNQQQQEITPPVEKPVEQMTQAEKNTLILQLRQQLIVLLTYLRDLLLAQRQR